MIVTVIMKAISVIKKNLPSDRTIPAGDDVVGEGPP